MLDHRRSKHYTTSHLRPSELYCENAKMEPAMLANIVNLSTGEEMQTICNKVMESTLNEEYPDAGYVGKSFLIEQRSVPGKRYKNYRVAEIEITE